MRELCVRFRVRGREREPGCVSERVLLPGRVSAADRVWCRIKLHRRWRPGGRVLVLTWLGLDGHDIKRLRHDIRHMFSDGLRRGQRVYGRGSTARRVQLQWRLLIFIDHDDRMCGFHGHLPCVWCRLQLRRKWRPGSSLRRGVLLPCRLQDGPGYRRCRLRDRVPRRFIQRGERIDRRLPDLCRFDVRHVYMLRRLRVHGSVYRVCDYCWHLLDDRLRGGQRVYGRGSTARAVQLHCGLLIVIDHDNRVCGCHCAMQCVCGRTSVRRPRHSARFAAAPASLSCLHLHIRAWRDGVRTPFWANCGFCSSCRRSWRPSFHAPTHCVGTADSILRAQPRALAARATRIH